MNLVTKPEEVAELCDACVSGARLSNHHHAYENPYSRAPATAMQHCRQESQTLHLRTVIGSVAHLGHEQYGTAHIRIHSQVTGDWLRALYVFWTALLGGPLSLVGRSDHAFLFSRALSVIKH